MDNIEKSRLKEFLRAEKNSRSREHLLTSRLVYDLGVAAAIRGLDLAIYTPAVDRDGFDLIVDDRDSLIPIQLKSVFGKTSKWAVHRRLLRPKRHDLDLYGFESDPAGEGVSGAIVLIDVTCEDTFVTSKYLYTDINVLSALWHNIVQLPEPQRRVLERLRKSLTVEPSGKVEVTRSAFLRPRSSEHLLALAGLHSRYQGAWPNLLCSILRHEYQGAELPAPEDHIRHTLREHLRSLCLDKI